MRAAAVAAACLVAIVPGAAADTGRSIFADPLVAGRGQHATVVEPDTFAHGATVVAAFQVGRIDGGGAAAVGWATSSDAGRTWRSGLLPGLTEATGPGGAFPRASDPSVAYDPVRRVWLVSTLGLDDDDARFDGPTSAILVSRSADGVRWEAPTFVAPRAGRFAHDKNWTVCDVWPRSRFRGRCYTAWSVSDADGRIAVSRSVDGGATWSDPALAPADHAVGAQPVVRPDGTVVIVYLAGGRLESVRSRDGGVTWDQPIAVAPTLFSPVAHLRAGALPSAEVGGDGRVWVAWGDCSTTPECVPGRTTNDVLLASSADGRAWSRPVRVPLGARRAGLDFVMPGLAVDRGTVGRRTRLAVVAYTLGPDCDDETCPVGARTVVSANAGETWTAPVAFAQSGLLRDAPRSGPLRMVGDYLSASWLRGPVAVTVATLPVAPFDGAYHVELVAGRFAAPRAVLLDASPATPRAGRLLRVSIDVRPLPASRRVRCAARAGGRALAVAARRRAGTRATCAWRVPRASAGRPLTGSIALGAVRRGFSWQVAGGGTARR